MTTADWIKIRRPEDGVELGWIRSENDGFIAIDLLGRPRTDVVDWCTAEEALCDLGIGYLAEPYELSIEGRASIRVRLAEVSSDGIRVVEDEWGMASAVGAPHVTHVLTFPAPLELREYRP